MLNWTSREKSKRSLHWKFIDAQYTKKAQLTLFSHKFTSQYFLMTLLLSNMKMNTEQQRHGIKKDVLRIAFEVVRLALVETSKYRLFLKMFSLLLARFQYWHRTINSIDFLNVWSQGF